VVDREGKLLAEEGVRFVTNTEIGKDYPAENLLKEYDAAVICTGATRPATSGRGRGLRAFISPWSSW
jgi:glutamate synthase (NADPH/NADH) small chain